MVYVQAAIPACEKHKEDFFVELKLIIADFISKLLFDIYDLPISRLISILNSERIISLDKPLTILLYFPPPPLPTMVRQPI